MDKEDFTTLTNQWAQYGENNPKEKKPKLKYKDP